jgi:hypothetical protein
MCCRQTVSRSLVSHHANKSEKSKYAHTEAIKLEAVHRTTVVKSNSRPTMRRHFSCPSRLSRVVMSKSISLGSRDSSGLRASSSLVTTSTRPVIAEVAVVECVRSVCFAGPPSTDLGDIRSCGRAYSHVTTSTEYRHRRDCQLCVTPSASASFLIWLDFGNPIFNLNARAALS